MLNMKRPVDNHGQVVHTTTVLNDTICKCLVCALENCRHRRDIELELVQKIKLKQKSCHFNNGLNCSAVNLLSLITITTLCQHQSPGGAVVQIVYGRLSVLRRFCSAKLEYTV